MTVYRVGDLDKYQRKADSLYQMFGRSTGYFGTGYYFCTKPENCCTMTREDDPLYALHLKEGIKLIRGTPKLHELLKQFHRYMFNYPLLCNKEQLEKRKKFARSARDFFSEYNPNIGSNMKESFEVWGEDYDGWKEWFDRDWDLKNLAKCAKEVPELEEFVAILESDNPDFDRLDEIQKENEAIFDYERMDDLKDLSFDVLSLLPIHLNTDEESRKFYAEVILDEANKMDKLVKQLLELMTLEYGKREFNNKCFNIVELEREVIRKSNVMIDSNNIEIKFDNDKKIEVFADDFYIEQIFTNYITNAIKNIKEIEGKKFIEIKNEIDEKNKKVRISVFNTGENIPEENINRIWNRFYKIDDSRNREDGGTGIGLSLVKAIMNNYKNEYGVINKENGVEFYFDLNET